MARGFFSWSGNDDGNASFSADFLVWCFLRFWKYVDSGFVAEALSLKNWWLLLIGFGGKHSYSVIDVHQQKNT